MRFAGESMPKNPYSSPSEQNTERGSGGGGYRHIIIGLMMSVITTMVLLAAIFGFFAFVDWFVGNQ